MNLSAEDKAAAAQKLWDAGLKLSFIYLLYALINGFFLFLTRQTIIVMSRNIEYDLKIR